MKLIDLMKKEGIEFPDYAVAAIQFSDGNIRFVNRHGSYWKSSKKPSILADDHGTQVVTRVKYNFSTENPLTREALIERVKIDGWPVSPDYESEYRGWNFDVFGKSHPCFVSRLMYDGGVLVESYVYWRDIYEKDGSVKNNKDKSIGEKILSLYKNEGSICVDNNKKHNHYFKDVTSFEYVDVYRVLDLFDVTQPAIQHSIKKLLCGGKRGAKDTIKDYQEAIDSISRAIEMIKEDEE